MKAYLVIEPNGKICFTGLHRYKVASYLIPSANLLNNDNPLANKQWEKLVECVDELNKIGDELNYREYTIVLEEFDEDTTMKLLSNNP